MDPAITDLVDLTAEFVDGRRTATDFDQTYRRLFSRLPVVDEETFRVLEDLAMACSEYVEDPAMRDEPGDLGEDELLAQARTTLTAMGRRR